MIDQQRLAIAFPRSEPAVDCFFEHAQDPTDTGTETLNFFLFRKEILFFEKIKKKIKVEDSDITTKVYWAREAQMENIKIWKAVSITTFPCIGYVFHMGFGYGSR